VHESAPVKTIIKERIMTIYRSIALVALLACAPTAFAGSPFTTAYKGKPEISSDSGSDAIADRIRVLEVAKDVPEGEPIDPSVGNGTPETKIYMKRILGGDASQAMTPQIGKSVESALQESEDAKAKTATSDDDWEYFSFTDEDEGLSTFEAQPFGKAHGYKVNAQNMNIKLGEGLQTPLQIYIADISAGGDDETEDANSAKLLDPTQGIALSFPVIWRYLGDTDDKFCRFESAKDGACMAGFDLNVRYVELIQQEAPEDQTQPTAPIETETDEKGAFGASLGANVSMKFPARMVGKQPTDVADGHLGFSLGYRQYYQNTDASDALFPEVVDEDGKPIDFDHGYGAFNAAIKLTIYGQFALSMEYFAPTEQKEFLKDVFKVSLTFDPKAKEGT
jgi:hypothetical protein